MMTSRINLLAIPANMSAGLFKQPLGQLCVGLEPNSEGSKFELLEGNILLRIAELSRAFLVTE